MTHSLRVVKIGGSLLNFRDLAVRLRDWLVEQPPALNVLVVGGGPLVDCLRETDRLHGIGDEVCHHLAIETMGVTTRLVRKMLADVGMGTIDVLADADAVERWRTVASTAVSSHGPTSLAVIDPVAFLRREETRDDIRPLPHTWDVTSDSIAARLATRTNADELVLLKSCLPPSGATVSTAAMAGYFDPVFPIAAGGRKVRCVNLRDKALADTTFAAGVMGFVE